MSYALRTTLLLGGFWLLIFLGGVYQVHFRMSTQEEELTTQESEIREELEANEALVASLPMIQEELSAVELEWQNRNKSIPRAEAAHLTYDYIDKIVTKQRTTLNFDFIAKEQYDSNEVHYADYHVSGEALFIDLYRFIWYIENLPRYVEIKSVEMQEASPEEKTSPTSQRWVKFNLYLSALAADREGFDTVEMIAGLKPVKDKHDPFSPPSKAKRKIPANRRGLPNVFSSTLRALTPTQAYLIDQKGELKILELGDDVYLGKLVDIRPEENRAIFNLDQLYPPRKVPLVLDTKK